MAKEITQLQVDVKETGAKQASVNIDKVTKSLAEATKQADYFIDKQGKLRDSSGRYAKSTNEVTTGLRKMAGDADKATRSTRGLGKVVDDTKSSFGYIGQAITKAVSFQSIRSLFDIGDKYREMSDRVRMATDTVEDFNYVQKRLSASANTSFRPLAEVQELFLATSNNLRNSGYSLKDSVDITDSLSHAFVRNATSAQKASAAIDAYDNALNTGEVNPQAWQLLSSGLGTLATSIGDVYGKSAQEINALGRSGKLSVEWISEGLRNSLDDNKNAADSMVNTVEGAFTRLHNSFSETWGEFNKNIGLTSIFAAGIIFIADNIDKFLIPAFGVAGTAITIGLSTARKAVWEFNAALMANPIALVVGGITAAVAALYYFRNELVLNKEEGLTLGDVVGGIWDNIAENASRSADIISDAFSDALDWLGLDTETFQNAIANSFSYISRVVRMPANVIINAFTFAFEAVKGIVNNFVDFIKAAGGSIAYFILKPMQELVNNILGIIKSVVGNIVSIIPERFMSQDIRNIIDSIDNFMEPKDFAEGFRGNVDTMAKMLTDGFSEAWKDMKFIMSRDPVGGIAEAMADLIINNKMAQDRKAKRIARGSLGNGNSSGGGGGGNPMLSDRQKEYNEIIALGNEYDKMFDNMYFELSLVGQTQKAIEELTFARELEGKAKGIGLGMSEENIVKLEEETARILAEKAAIDELRAAQENDPMAGIREGFNKFAQDVGTVRDGWAAATNSLFTSMTDAFVNFASGTQVSFSQMTVSILRDLSQILIKASIVNAMTAIQGAGGFWGKLVGTLLGGKANGGIVGFANGGFTDFDYGGFTGVGGKYEPAGIVHRGEVVFSQADVARHGGVYQVERMRRGLANGGSLIPSQLSHQIGQDQNLPPINISIVQNQDGSAEVESTMGGKLLESQVSFIVDKRIGHHMRDGNSLSKYR